MALRHYGRNRIVRARDDPVTGGQQKSPYRLTENLDAAETPIPPIAFVGRTVSGPFPSSRGNGAEDAMVGSCARQVGDCGDLHQLGGGSRRPSRAQQTPFICEQLAGATRCRIHLRSANRVTRLYGVPEPRITLPTRAIATRHAAGMTELTSGCQGVGRDADVRRGAGRSLGYITVVVVDPWLLHGRLCIVRRCSYRASPHAIASVTSDTSCRSGSAPQPEKTSGPRRDAGLLPSFPLRLIPRRSIPDETIGPMKPDQSRSASEHASLPKILSARSGPLRPSSLADQVLAGPSRVRWSALASRARDRKALVALGGTSMAGHRGISAFLTDLRSSRP